jgi:hypothetical protein
VVKLLLLLLQHQLIILLLLPVVVVVAGLVVAVVLVDIGAGLLIRLLLQPLTQLRLARREQRGHQP